MGLAKLLCERVGINLLNELYPRESSKTTESPAFSLDELESRLHEHIKATTLDLLVDRKLIAILEQEHPKTKQKECLITITSKGKQFIRAFDNVRAIFYHNDPVHNEIALHKPVADNTEQETYKEQSSIDIEYVLTDLEEKILKAIYSLSSQTHQAVSSQEIIRLIYPHDVYHKKISIISHYTKKLEELKLITKVKENRHTLLFITPSGIRTSKKLFSSQQSH